MNATQGHTSIILPVTEYNLGATLNSGQAFRWYPTERGWAGVVGRRWVCLEPAPGGLRATAAKTTNDWEWLVRYLQVHVDIRQVIHTFPDDTPLREAVTACRGLRLLRQDPWECLAAFILSSTKQIVQIRQIIELLCQCYGEPILVPAGYPPAFAFPPAPRLAQLSESDLRRCKMGFRAPWLLAVARKIATGNLDLATIQSLPLDLARTELLRLPGVGRKITDCVLLFAFGFNAAFPVDVWVLKALRQLYFPRRRPRPARLRAFADTHFGPYAGYAQQYLFHYMRTLKPNLVNPEPGTLNPEP